MKILYYFKLASRSIIKNKRIYYPYLICGSLLAAMFYILFAINKITGESQFYGLRTTSAMLGFGLFIFGVISLFILFLMNSAVIKTRMREFGLYSVLGMNKRNIISLLFSEVLLMALIALAAGIGLGILFSQLTYLVLIRLTQIPVALDFVVPISSVIETAVVFGFGYALVFCYDAVLILRSKTVDMVYGEKRGEREPRLRILTLLIGTACLLYGYIGAQTAPGPFNAVGRFFYLVLAVIVATYFLFQAGSIFVLKQLKKRDSYYTPVPFITVSGMMFRMNKNAVGLASICILSTCALVTLSATSGLFMGAEHAIRQHVRGDFELTYYLDVEPDEKHIEEPEVIALAGADLRNHQLEPVQVSRFYSTVLEFRFDAASGTAVAREKGERTGQQELYALSSVTDLVSWNDRYREQISVGPLAPDEVLIVRAKKDPRPHLNAVEISGQTYRVAAEIESPIVAQEWESYYVVLPTRELLRSIDEKYYRALECSMGFDVTPASSASADKDTLLRAFSVDLRDRYGEIPRLGRCTTISNLRDEFRGVFGTLMFLGLFFSVMFVIAASTIMYYKQISEGIDDRMRFRIMHQVGMEDELVNRTIRRQILWIFLLPLAVASLHVGFAFKIINQILQLFGVVHIPTVLSAFVGSVVLFTLFYFVIYLLTARVYKRILRSA